MSKKKRIKEKKRQRLLKEGYLECYYCDEPVKQSALVCPHCRRWYASGKKLIASVIVAALLISLGGGYYGYYMHPQEEVRPGISLVSVMSASPTGISVSVSSDIRINFNKDMLAQSVQDAFSIQPSVAGTFSWDGARNMTFRPSNDFAAATIYTVTVGEGARSTDGSILDCGVYRWRFTTEGGGAPTRRAVGTGENDFWIKYAPGHPLVGQSVNHPQWAKDAVNRKVVMILAHTEGCYPCAVQTDICGSVNNSYKGSITYYELIAGTNEPQATEAFTSYDPTGAPYYVPQTIILTMVKDANGNKTIGGHSWEGVVDEVALKSWIDDAISYHSEND